MATTTFDTTDELPVAARTYIPGPAGVAAIAIALVAWYLWSAISWRQGALFMVGAAAGVVLYHAAFGFTSSWRVFISDRRGAGLRAQMLMLAVTCAVFFPLLAGGTLFGQPLRGSVSPAGNVVGTSLRPMFDLKAEKTQTACSEITYTETRKHGEHSSASRTSV